MNVRTIATLLIGSMVMLVACESKPEVEEQPPVDSAAVAMTPTDTMLVDQTDTAIIYSDTTIKPGQPQMTEATPGPAETPQSTQPSTTTTSTPPPGATVTPPPPTMTTAPQEKPVATTPPPTTTPPAATTPPASTPPAATPPPSPSGGKAIFVAQKCTTCHAISSQGLPKENPKGGDLSDVGTKHNADWIMAFITKQETLNGKKHMKKFGGTDEELHTLANWLASLK